MARMFSAENEDFDAEESAGPRSAGDSKTLLSRCLALTASIETSLSAPECFAKVAGNFDKQAVSFGALQWNFGSKTLQPIFLEVYRENRAAMAAILGTENSFFYNLLIGPHEELMAYFVNIQNQSNKAVWQRWKNSFYKVGMLPECVSAQEKAAQSYFDRALKYCLEFGLITERAVALMFDICVQNGSINEATKAKIFNRFSGARSEEEKLVIIAECRAQAAKPEYADDVKIRKIAIATGAGKIHGAFYDLREQFNISLEPAQELMNSARAVA